MQTAWDGILTGIQFVWNWIKDNWPLLLGILFGPIGIAAAIIITYWDQIKAGALAVWNWIQSTWDKLLGILRWPFEQAWAIIQNVWGGIKGFFGNIPGWISSALSTVENVITAPFKSAWNLIKSALIDPLKSAFDGVTGAISSALSAVESTITAPFKAAWNFIQNNIISPLKGAWNGVARAINAVSVSFTIPSNAITDALHIGGKGFDWKPPFSLPILQSGGLITRTGLIYAHAGEAITPLPARARGGPLVQIAHAHFSERIDIETFGRRLAWTVETAGV
jgi:phage-related protein